MNNRRIYQSILIFISIVILSFNEHRQNDSNGISDDQNYLKLEQYLDKIAKKKDFVGSILVDIKGEKIISRSYGLSNLNKNIKNTSKTVYDIGSLTKQFTAAAIIKLETLGSLSLNDNLTKYFVGVPEDKMHISIHHLLTHSSGLPSHLGEDYEITTSNKFINDSFKQELMFMPGDGYNYSNIGYSLLGIIIEKVSDMTYEQFLYKYLWKEAKMENTGYTRPSYDEDKIAIGYDSNGEEWGKPNSKKWDRNSPYWNLKANGGIMSTIDDMYMWHLALQTDVILSSEEKKKFFTPYVSEGNGSQSHYAYGWVISNTQRKTRLATHNGSNGIFYADFWRFLDENITIIILTNKFNKNSLRVASQISNLIFE